VKLAGLVTPRRVALAIVVLALFFALEGGEYGMRDWYELRGQSRDEEERLVELTREVDSLAVVLRQLERDPATQERVAREEFGMIRDGDFLFRLIPGER
jgi:cell division protein FtsB